jgi:hypothetical protein
MRKSAEDLSLRLIVARKKTVRTTPFTGPSPELACGGRRLIGRDAIGSMKRKQSFNPPLLVPA